MIDDYKSIFQNQILPNVQRPSRYIGNELNSIHKEWDKARLKVALSYPDTYEIGMSNLGVQILYSILNSLEYVLAERVFCPLPDMEAQLQTSSRLWRDKLQSLESFRRLHEFDLIGFSLGHELTYTNIITILKLGGIPLLSSERGENDPLVLGGGPCAFNPEPVSDFFDFFVIGEAEEIIIEIAQTLLAIQSLPRKEKLQKLSNIPGIYVPSIGNKASKRYVKDLNHTPYPTKPIIPFVEVIHDRGAVEIMRGCKWGCKFCQAGWTTRPVREKEKELIFRQADEIIRNSGYEELSLVSLSSSDHSQIEELAKTLAAKYAGKRINISLPSLRTDTFSVKLAKEISRVRPSSLTVAPEAGTQRLRDIIGKNLTEEQILEGVAAAFSEGIESIKLYFMVGLPSETEEDLAAICELAKKILETGKRFTRRARVTINLSTFIPKPHTPFQWERQISIEETLEKQRFIKQHSRGRDMEIRWHQAEASWLEGIFSRGDKKLVKVICKAWDLGARLDAWGEHYKFNLWQKAFSECDVNPDDYLKEREKDKSLPWDYIDCGVPKDTLLRLADAKHQDQDQIH